MLAASLTRCASGSHGSAAPLFARLCVCVCVCVRGQNRQVEREREKKRMYPTHPHKHTQKPSRIEVAVPTFWFACGATCVNDKSTAIVGGGKVVEHATQERSTNGTEFGNGRHCCDGGRDAVCRSRQAGVLSGRQCDAFLQEKHVGIRVADDV